MKRIGVIGVAGGWSSERLADAMQERTGFRLLIEMDQVSFDVSSGRAVCGDVDLCSLDALIVKKIGRYYSPDLMDRLNILEFVAGKGTPVFSSPQKIGQILNRLHCTTRLRMAGMPIPETTVTENIPAAVAAVQRYGRAVLKPLYTSKARGMLVVDAKDEMLKDQITEFQHCGNTMIYIQKFLDHPGKDLGITFLGGNYVGTYARVGSGDSWNTTTVSGGRYEAYDPSQEVIELARRAQEPMGLDLTCVDVVETDDGPKIFEVSAFGGFKGLWESGGIDLAQQYSDYVLTRIESS